MTKRTRIDLSQSPTIDEAIFDPSFVVGVRGPVGSGKSTGGVGYIMKAALRQQPASDNIRYTRHGVIRNTNPELKSTTIKTFLDWVPEGKHGRVVYSSPILYHVRRKPLYDNETGELLEPGVDCEIYFVSLDKPRDVGKLLSFELTTAWVNEARQIPKTLIDSLTERVARYPNKEKGSCTHAGIFMDTNSMDSDHWWPATFDFQEQAQTVIEVDGHQVNISWKGYTQPPAVLELEAIAGGEYRSIEPGYTDLVYREAETVKSADKVWGVNPRAENLANLRPGYYHQQLANKPLDHIQCYQQNKLVFVKEGRPAVPSYIPTMMGAVFEPFKDVPLVIGVDVGGGTLQPAAGFLQRSHAGIWCVQSEVIGQSMGVHRFLDEVKAHLRERYPDIPVKAVWLDPAAEQRDQILETKVLNYFIAAGFPARCAPTQDPATRISALTQPCERLIAGKPGLLVNTEHAPKIHKGLSGAWYYRRIQAGGATARYAGMPEKNEYSHPCEAVGYALCGEGEGRPPESFRLARVRAGEPDGMSRAEIDFDLFG